MNEWDVKRMSSEEVCIIGLIQRFNELKTDFVEFVSRLDVQDSADMNNFNILMAFDIILAGFERIGKGKKDLQYHG